MDCKLLSIIEYIHVPKLVLNSVLALWNQWSESQRTWNQIWYVSMYYEGRMYSPKCTSLSCNYLSDMFSKGLGIAM